MAYDIIQLYELYDIHIHPIYYIYNIYVCVQPFSFPLSGCVFKNVSIPPSKKKLRKGGGTTDSPGETRGNQVLYGISASPSFWDMWTCFP
jgi:hypothetical protein